MPRLHGRIAAALLGALGLGCSMQRPSVTPQAVRIWGVDLAGVVVRTDLDVFNPNGFSLNVAAVSGTITLADQVPLGSASVPTASYLPAHAWQHVTADMRLPWLNLPSVLALAGTRSVVPYTFDGNAAIGGRFRVTIPFRIRGEVAAKELLRAGMAMPLGASPPATASPFASLVPTPGSRNARAALAFLPLAYPGLPSTTL